MKKVVFICFSFALTCCSNNALPTGILAGEKMEKVVYDLMKTDEYLSNFVIKDTTVNIKMKRSILYEQVFKLHDTNRKDFFTSYRYYQQHPDLQKNLFDSLLAVSGRENTVKYNKPAKLEKAK